MKFSYHWLQTYFNEPLPAPQELADFLTFHSFEVESVSPEEDDTVFEIAILPNRRHDCLSHRGIAREISVVTGIPLARDPFLEKIPAWNTPALLTATIGDTEGAPRYMAALMSGVMVEESPEWLKERLRAVGQKSVNNIVDATNYVMFELGQPLHAFDADCFVKEGDGVKIAVRSAKKSEHISLLGGEERVLDTEDLVIVDGVSNSPLGVAGIKGGRAGEITPRTKNIIIESANFDPVRIRKTATRLGLRTDASTRFESGLAPEQAAIAMKEVIMLVQKLTGGTPRGVHDTGGWIKKEVAIPLSVGEVNKLLGTALNGGILLDVLNELNFSHKKDGDGFIVTPPFERLDVETKEDLIEEVGRVYGYEKIAAVSLPKGDKSPAVNKNFYYTEKIRDILIAQGFSEVYTHAIGEEGNLELANPLAEDKKFLRRILPGFEWRGMFLQNVKNKEFLGVDLVNMFEIGKVFSENGEGLEVVVGTTDKKNMDTLLDAITQKLGIVPDVLLQEGIRTTSAGMELFRFGLESVIAGLSHPSEYRQYHKPEIEPRYRPISQFPFVLRDVAIFVPEGTGMDVVLEIIKNEAGRLLARARLFDEFKKGGKTSYAFRLVFQSREKTLTDGEVNEIMTRVVNALNSQEGFVVR